MIMKMLNKLKFNLGKLNISNIEFIALNLVLFLNVYKPKNLVMFSKTLLGKLILLVLLITSIMHSKLLGFTVVLAIIIFSDNYYEGLKNMNNEKKNSNNDSNENEREEFLKKHCKIINGTKVIVDGSGNKLQLNNINNVYKNLKFNNGLCNPCNPSCSFEITHSNEKLSVEEKLKSQPSNK